MKTRTDGNGAVTNYAYDGLNRLLGKTYSGTTVTPVVTYCYDGAATAGDGQCAAGTVRLSHGHLTESRASVTIGTQNVVSLTTYTGFDELGRITGSQQRTNGMGPYTFSYGYDLAGGLTSLTYPSGRVVATAYDYVERPTDVTLMVGGSASTKYAQGGTYAAHGGLATLGLANNAIPESWGYNSRLQMSALTAGAAGNPLFSLSVDYGTANNGNVASQSLKRGGVSWLQVYQYDAVNRLTLAAEHPGDAANPACPDAASTWCKGYGHDQPGNMWLSSYNAGFTPDDYTPLAPTNYDGGNHFVKPAPTVVSYDNAGNQTQRGANTLVYDAEGRLESDTLNNATTVYVYDAGGRRVMKQNPGGTSSIYVYDAAGALAAEYDSAGTLYTPTCGTPACYLIEDQLGSTRVVANADGTVYGCHDYAPYGEELTSWGGRSGGCWGVTDSTMKFTGKERDSETGLDYFGARYFSSAQGRFTSPDWSDKPEPIPYANLRDPQTLNLYTYGHNNPLSNRDIDGHCTVDGEDHGWVWCAAHAIGLTQTQHEQAQDARNFFTANQVTMGGQVVDPTKLSDKEVLTAFHTFNDEWRDLVAQGANPAAVLGAAIPPLGQLPTVYRGGSNLDAREIDVKIDKSTGLVKPGRGISVNSDPSGLDRFGGAKQVVSVPSELEIVQTSGTHYEIAPKQPMTLQRSQELLKQVQLK